MAQWIEFVLMGDTGKTLIWDVFAKEGGTMLGRVKWFGRWRRYSFFPCPETVYEETCLRDIAEFMDEAMQARLPPASAVEDRGA